MTPQIYGEETLQAVSYRQPNLTYRVGNKTVVGKVDNMEAIQQSIRHILLTERYSSPIYDDNYGVELEQYIGKDIGFISADIENTLREALCQDDRITDVMVNDVKKSEKQDSACIIKFTVFTIYGDLEDSISVIQ